MSAQASGGAPRNRWAVLLLEKALVSLSPRPPHRQKKKRWMENGRGAAPNRAGPSSGNGPGGCAHRESMGPKQTPPLESGQLGTSAFLSERSLSFTKLGKYWGRCLGPLQRSSLKVVCLPSCQGACATFCNAMGADWAAAWVCVGRVRPGRAGSQQHGMNMAGE